MTGIEVAACLCSLGVGCDGVPPHPNLLPEGEGFRVELRGPTPYPENEFRMTVGVGVSEMLAEALCGDDLLRTSISCSSGR